MEPIVGELVIRQRPAERRGLFSSRPQKLRVWSAHRNVWDMSGEDFPLRYLIHSSLSPEPIEVRQFGEQFFVLDKDLAWLLLDEVEVPEDEFDGLIGRVQSLGLHDLHVLDGEVWVRASAPKYSLEASDVVLVDVALDYGPDDLVFDPEFEDEVMAQARRVASGREVLQVSRVEVLEEPRVQEVSGVSPELVGHPVVVLAAERLDELDAGLAKLRDVVSGGGVSGSDVVAQLSSLSSLARRVLDEARALNNGGWIG